MGVVSVISAVESSHEVSICFGNIPFGFIYMELCIPRIQKHDVIASLSH